MRRTRVVGLVEERVFHDGGQALDLAGVLDSTRHRQYRNTVVQGLVDKGVKRDLQEPRLGVWGERTPQEVRDG